MEDQSVPEGIEFPDGFGDETKEEKPKEVYHKLSGLRKLENEKLWKKARYKKK